MSASKGMDETAPIPLPQDMQNAGLVEVHKIHQVLHFVIGHGVGLWWAINGSQ